MDNAQTSNPTYSVIGWGLIFILWGITILFDFVPFGVGVLGTGLILLGANGIRVMNGRPARDENTVLGILALSWGVLELARPFLGRLFGYVDLDWAIFAILLVELGLILLARGLPRIRKTGVENTRLNE